MANSYESGQDNISILMRKTEELVVNFHMTFSDNPLSLSSLHMQTLCSMSIITWYKTVL